MERPDVDEILQAAIDANEVLTNGYESTFLIDAREILNTDLPALAEYILLLEQGIEKALDANEALAEKFNSYYDKGTEPAEFKDGIWQLKQEQDKNQPKDDSKKVTLEDLIKAFEALGNSGDAAMLKATGLAVETVIIDEVGKEMSPAEFNKLMNARPRPKHCMCHLGQHKYATCPVHGKNRIK